MKNDRYEIRFSGAGGQGIVTAALILAEAAGPYDGKYVCQTQSYGPEARGGQCRAEVVISDTFIDYPKALKLDLLLAMNQASCNECFLDLKPEGLLVIDSTEVDHSPTSRAVAIPFTQIARHETGNQLTANMVALGAVGCLTRVVSIKGLEAALKARAPKGTAQMNLSALRAGIEAAKRVDIGALPVSITLEEQEI